MTQAEHSREICIDIVILRSMFDQQFWRIAHFTQQIEN